MGTYSDFHIHTGGCLAQEVLDFVSEEHGSTMTGDGGLYHNGPYTVEVRSAKWYDYEADITQFLRRQDHEIIVWVLRLYENGLGDPNTKRTRFRRTREGAVYVMTEQIDIVPFICGGLV